MLALDLKTTKLRQKTKQTLKVYPYTWLRGTVPSDALLNFQILRLNKLECYRPKVPIQVMIVMLEMLPILSNELQDLLSPSFFSRLFGRLLSIGWVFLVSSGRLSGWQHISVETSGRLAASATQLPLYCAGRRMGKVFREPNIVCPNSLMSKKTLGSKKAVLNKHNKIVHQALRIIMICFSHSNREKIWESIWVRCVEFHILPVKGRWRGVESRPCIGDFVVDGVRSLGAKAKKHIKLQRFHLRMFVQVAINCIQLQYVWVWVQIFSLYKYHMPCYVLSSVVSSFPVICASSTRS